MLKLVMIFVINMVLAIPLQASDCSPVIRDCNAALDKCDQAIKDRDNTIDLQDKALQECRQQTLDLGIQLQSLEARQGSILHNPWFDGAIGAVLGILLYAYVRK